MLHKCPVCENVYDCSNKNYCITEAMVAFYVKEIDLADIVVSITKENTECDNNEYHIQCIYCQIEQDLGLKW